MLHLACVVLCAGVLTVCSICFSQEEQAGDKEQVSQEPVDQYRKSIEERQSEISVMSENAARIDGAIRALQDELEAESRRGRAKDVRARIQQLNGQKTVLDERIEAERRALSQDGKLRPGEALNRVAAKDLTEEQKQRVSEIGALDARIAALRSRLERRRGSRVRRESLNKQILELSSKRVALAARPGVDVQDTKAVRAELAKRFTQEEANRRSELEVVRARVAELKRGVAGENRRIRRENIEERIAELKLREQELDIGSPRRRYRRAAATAGRPEQAIGRGLRARQTARTRQAEMLDRRITMLRRRLRADGRPVRRKSISLQISELERQKQAIGKREAAFQPPPTRGFDGAPYRGTSDLDSEYKTPRTNDQQ
jgi:chromosome segregation ATPase